MERPLFFLIVILTLAGCGQAETPEQQVRTVIAEMELAAEARSVGAFMKRVSSEYRDAQGHDAEEASRRLRGFFIAHQAIHLLTRINEIEFPSADEARVKLQAALVGREAEADFAWSLAAELYEFDLALIRQGDDWMLTYVRYEPK